MSSSWKTLLHQQLQKQVGAKTGAKLFNKYAMAFPASYTDDCPVNTLIKDLIQIEQLSIDNPLAMDLYQINDKKDKALHIRLYQLGKQIPLSDILPMLENMNLRTENEHPYEITKDNKTIWISDFNVTYYKEESLEIKKIKFIFQEAFEQIRLGGCENDGFNKLVLGAELSWRDISIIRTYAKYLHQMRFRFSQSYIEKAVIAHTDITKNLIKLFKLKFDPHQKKSVRSAMMTVDTQIQHGLEAVSNLDEDRILRQLWNLIKATCRTNFFQTRDGQAKNYLAIKLSSNDIPELPLPKPLYEIFIYSPQFEGIHLRNALVARGGIRWSDRREDFRTEVLGLMKAQKVKNAIIVPSGAKGGFVLKSLPRNASREILQAEVIKCYQSFIRGLLDLTDNLKNGKLIRPTEVVCHDDPDYYLVVAADKGTATFSDIANSISKEYHFWLGDAFASGGKTGYDHKKMGITARGAWESIKRHFRELQTDIEQTDFSVIGIGDMSGDVFGNGMLYSEHIKLVAAFDHRHIFIDPTPNPKKSFLERLRLFNLPLSSWEDYNSKLISQGGGVFKRSVKSITITPEIKELLNITDAALAPNELIRAILKAKVDLLYSGGIGTYVKASSESQHEVGDKTNEFCRVNGNELRAKIVGEGANLSFTQLARVEYNLQGGLINTDFIDNSAGVDCSDHEVNIKILLNKEVAKKNLTEKKRNQLLVKMTDEVGKLVLQDNYKQALVMSFSSIHSTHYTSLYQNYIKDLEATGSLNRAIEFLPDDKKILERKSAGQGLTCPELAILLAYTKIHIKNEILKSDLPEDDYFAGIIATAFPALLSKLYGKAIREHSLRREIIATQLSNHIVNTMGITFVYRLQTETGASISDIARAHTVASSAYEGLNFHALIASLDFKIPVTMQYELLHHIRQLLNLATRWFLRSNRMQGDINIIIHHYAVSIKKLEKVIPTLMAGATKTYLDAVIQQFIRVGLPEETACRIASSRAMYTALNITEVATSHHIDLLKTASIYFLVGEQFNLVWFRDQIANDTREGHWNTLARLALRDELDALQRMLTIVILKSHKKESQPTALMAYWAANNAPLSNRWDKILAMLFENQTTDYTLFFIALRELNELIQVNKVR